jgi:hypothetical protein
MDGIPLGIANRISILNRMSEFQEIASSGGKIEVLHQEGDMVSLRLTHANPQPFVALQMGVALDGSRLEYWPIYGVDQRPLNPNRQWLRLL